MKKWDSIKRVETGLAADFLRNYVKFHEKNILFSFLEQFIKTVKNATFFDFGEKIALLVNPWKYKIL